jgi:hypothetical protein
MRRAEPDKDALLHDLLSIAERPPDDAFVLRVQRLALVEQRLRATEQAALRRFLVEVASSVSVAAAFLLIRSMATVASGGATSSGSLAAGLTLLWVWLCVDSEEFLPLGSGLDRVRSGRRRI